MAYIKIGGKLKNIQDPNGVIADASQINYDESTLVSDAINSLDEKIDKIKNGSSALDYTELETGNLDYLSNQGYYKIEKAKNYPDKSSETGFLTVNSIKENKIKQVWESNGFYATRFAELETAAIAESNITLLNSAGETLDPKWEGNTLYLEAGSTYILSGYLYGNIEIHSTLEDQSNIESTTLILNGLSIYSITQKAINYTCSIKKLILKLKENTYNTVYSHTNETINEISSDAAIYSENNLLITGTGALGIKNAFRGHGIKASDLTVSGYPFIYIDCCDGHDGIHATTSLIIENGKYDINYCNDGFGTGGNNTDNASAGIHIYDGDITISNCNKGINDKYGTDETPSGTVEGIRTNINMVNCKKASFAGVKILNTISVTSNLSDYNMLAPKEFFSSGKLSIYSEDEDEDGDKVYKHIKDITDPGTSDYSIDDIVVSNEEDPDATSATTYVLYATGYIPHSISISRQKTKLLLDNAYIESSGDKPTIYYTAGSKSLKVRVYNGTSYVLQTKSTDFKDSADYDAIKSEKNLEIYSDGNIFVSSVHGDGIDGSKVIIRGDGLRYFENCGACGAKMTEAHIGADPEDITAGTAKNSDQSIYIFGNKDCGLFGGNGNAYKYKFNPSAYNPEKNLSGTITVDSFQRGIIVAETVYSHNGGTAGNSSNFYYLKDGKIATDANITIDGGIEFEELDLTKLEFISTEQKLVGDWTVLKETVDIDLSDYVSNTQLADTINKIDKVHKFNSIELAQQALDNGELSLGDVCSVYVGTSDSYTSDYKIQLVVLNGSSLVFKELTGGSGDSTVTGSVDFKVIDVKIDGETVDIENSSVLECNIGSDIVITYEFTSENYPDVRGTFYAKVGSSIAAQEKVYPDGDQKTWTYNTGSLSAGTYTVSLYGVESTNKQSSRTNFKLQVGGLSVASSFNEENTFIAGSNISIPVNVTAADISATVNAHVSLDGTEIINKTVQSGASTLTITPDQITTGTHAIKVWLTNSKGKTSNELKYSIIVAKEGVIYVISDAETYSKPAGTRVDITLRTIQVGQNNEKFAAKLVITDKNGSVVKLNGKDLNTYTLDYGVNIVSLIGLSYNEADTDDAAKGYSEYTCTFTVSPADKLENTAADVTKVLKVQITENDYNISATTDGLLCGFKASGKTNTSDDKSSWEDISGNNTNITFNNFNWSTNGWLPVTQSDGSTTDTALVINSGAYAEIDVTPFLNEIEDGITISIDFETQDILDSNAKVASCLYEYDGYDTEIHYLRDDFGDWVKAGDDNVINFFKRVGRYCFINGKDYGGKNADEADPTAEYDITMVYSERQVNYNMGDLNESYNNNILDESGTGVVGSYGKYDDEKAVDFTRYTGSSYSSVTKQRGFYLDTQYAILSHSSSLADPEDKFHLYFSENTRTRIDLIITRSEEGPYYFPSMIGYINGTLSLMQQITDLNYFQQKDTNNRKYKVYLGCKAKYDQYGKLQYSDTGECKIYSFRIYNKALTPEEVLHNYAAEIPVEATKKTVIDNNNLLKTGSLAQLPQICITGYTSPVGLAQRAYTSSTVNQFIMQLANSDSAAVSDLKKMKLPAYITYIDPSNTANNWTYTDPDTGNEDTNIPIRLQFQGS